MSYGYCESKRWNRWKGQSQFNKLLLILLYYVIIYNYSNINILFVLFAILLCVFNHRGTFFTWNV